MSGKKNEGESEEVDIWCCCCGDRTYYANLEKRTLEWFLKEQDRGIGICIPCSEVLDESYLVIPPEEEDE